MKLFHENQVLLGSELNRKELDHFKYVVGTIVGKVIGENRSHASKLKKLMPIHHHHENSGRPLSSAITFIVKPYPYNETKNADTIKLLVKVQDSYLKSVAEFYGNSPEILNSLKALEDQDISEEEREVAEVRMKQACLDYGELIMHGDLLTVKMIQEAISTMSGSATAYGRLEFLGPCRIQLLHMKMKKVGQDYALYLG